MLFIRKKPFYEKSKIFLKKIHNGECQAITSSITLLEIALDTIESDY